MNFCKLIQNNEELSKLPFLIVFRTLTILKELNLLKEGVSDVDKTE